MILFKTQRLIIRYFTKEDEEAFFSIAGNQEVMQYIRPVKSRESSNRFLTENILMYQTGSCIGRFAVFEKKQSFFIGTFSFLYLGGEADFHLGYAFIKSAWGKGYGTEIVKAGTAFFFDHTTYPHLFAITDVNNIASQKVLLKNGYTEEAPRWEEGKWVNQFRINRPTPLTDF